jgi:hypothetical protein
MVTSARRLALSVFPLAALLVVSGCDDLGRAVGEAIRIIMVIVVLALVFQVVAVVVGVVGVVMLARKTPSLRWGITAIVCGLLQILPTGISLIGIMKPNGLHAISVIEVIVLLYVGIRNVMLAPRRAAPTPGDSTPPDDLA